MKPLKILITILIIIILSLIIYIKITLFSKIEVPSITTISDIDKDWINDIDDILQGARYEIKNKTNYKSAYYSWGYPPKNEWVCTDVIWRALQNAWINLKKLMDEDISINTNKYSRVNWKPDPNIDFRRVSNLDTFLKRNAISLTLEIIPRDIENLKNWQAWDIVTFDKPKNHTAIISDKRNKDWVPYIIHNSSPIPREDDWLIYWDKDISKIIGHYRWKYQNF
jgi:uncharacterized protein YijF (DUF1287 family)